MIKTLISLTILSLLFLCLIGCGRRGEPVPVMGAGGSPIKRPVEGVVKGPEGPAEQGVEGTAPGPPAGLAGVYTGRGVVLTWDEVAGQEIRAYRVYRSSDGEFELIGRSITPAFIDRDVKPDRRYLYRVTAVTETEGPPSKEIEVITRSR
jgi:hypothetical protein